jgi:hypothetical protein
VPAEFRLDPGRMTQAPTDTTRTTSDFGTVGWALRKRRPDETLRTIVTAGRVLLPTIPAKIRLRLGRPDATALSYDIDQIPVPDSKIAREAEEECRDASPSTGTSDQ